MTTERNLLLPIALRAQLCDYLSRHPWNQVDHLMQPLMNLPLASEPDNVPAEPRGPEQPLAPTPPTVPVIPPPAGSPQT